MSRATDGFSASTAIVKATRNLHRGTDTLACRSPPEHAYQGGAAGFACIGRGAKRIPTPALSPARWRRRFRWSCRSVYPRGRPSSRSESARRREEEREREQFLPSVVARPVDAGQLQLLL